MLNYSNIITTMAKGPMLGQTQLKKEIGKRLKEAREAAGYTSIEQFCKNFKLELEKYLAHENGTQSLRASDAILYSRIFKKPVQWLMLLGAKIENAKDSNPPK